MPGPQPGPVPTYTASSVAARVQQRECGLLRAHSTPITFMLKVGLLLAMMHAARVSAAEATLLPYTPTNILVPGSTSGVAYGRETGNANSTAYIFTPNADGSVDLLAVDISSSLAASSVSSSAETLTRGLPFLVSSTNTTTFTPTLTSDGSIVAYAGDCSSDTGSSVWVYNTTTSHQASWVEHSITSNGAATGPYFLGGGFSFSQTISPSLSQPLVYAYGGQCPGEAPGDKWTSAASYSNSMVRLTASTSSSSRPVYTANRLSLKSQPIAEAGFSLTSLPPATSNISGIVTQSINSVVLGGHTQTAFVNMSTAAVWSLPEETWSFIAISGPSGSTSSDTAELAKNDGAVTEVQPRSGHTAVLNEAGSALVILGGWVGDTSQAAQPQLAVLQMSGSGFGEWTWSVPDQQPLADGEGIYGHGAALLPGNVMMVSGGYAISPGSSGSGLGKRDSIGVAGGQLQMFFNLTSLTWSDSYTNPISASAPSAGGTAPPTSPYKLGLGLGLGLGIPVLLLVLAICFFCWRRRQRLRHQARDEHIRNLATGTAFITSDEMLERENVYPWGPRTAARWYTGGHDPYLRDQGNKLGYENLRAPEGARSTSDDPMAVESPGAYRRDVRRRPVPRVARGLYQPTGIVGDDVISPGGIHPILEDEEDEIAAADAIAPDRDENDEDPFTTPVPSTPTRAGLSLASPIVFGAPGNTTAGSGPASPTESTPRARPQHPEVQDWISDIDASDALITARIQPHSTTFRNSGKTSPTRRPSVRLSEDEPAGGARTDSNLSESNRSTFSFIVNRSDSLRVAGPGAGAGNLTVSKSRGEQERTGTSHSDKSGSSNSNTTQESFTTAKSITALQSEGPGLLLGRPRPISDIEDLGHMSDDDPLAPGSPSKSKPPRRSWFGSLKRVFSAGAGSGSSNGSSSRTGSPTHGRSSDYDVLGLGNLGLGGVGLLQKRRQGRSAWDEAGASASGGGQRTGEGWEEDDWDIEKAVEQRLVQVMFSVPKDRLRVVNADTADLVSLEESVVLVDPAKDDPTTPETAATSKDEEKVTAQDDGQEEAAEDVSSVASQTEEASRARRERIQQGKQPERPHLLLKVPRPPGSDTSEDSRRRSISPVLRTAETIRIERPRTRVLDMVESLESRSEGSSPERRSTPDKKF